MSPDLKSVPAREAYTGAPFKVNREYAEKFSEGNWAILSAKYGLVRPDAPIPGDYDVTFAKPSTKPIPIDDLKRQAFWRFGQYDKVVVLGGKTYADMVKKAFSGAKVCSPVAGLPIGKALGKVKKAVKQNRPFRCEVKR